MTSNPAQQSLALNSNLAFSQVTIQRRTVKRLSLRVRENGDVEMVGPKRLALAEFERFYCSKQQWVEKQRQHFLTAATQRPALADDTLFIFNAPITRQPGSDVTLTARSIIAPPTLDKTTLYRRVASQYLPQRLTQLAKQCGLHYQRCTIRAQRTRWGSCSAKGTISLNWRLIQMPQEISDYVIIHELCHTVHMNHSADFWRLVEQHCNSVTESRRWLKKQGMQLPD